MQQKKWGVVGAGKLASCFLRGWIKSETFSESDFIVSCRSKESRKRLTQEWPSLTVTFDNGELVRRSKSVLIGVKPYDAEKLLEELGADFQERALVLSLAAGLNRSQLLSALSERRDLRVGRLMANTAVAFNLGLMGLDSEVDGLLNPEEKNVFKKLGSLEVIDENRFDEFTVASASAPAFVLFMQSALAKAIGGFGFEPSVVRSLTLSLLESTQHQLKSDFHPEKWVQQIATPGGMTAEGIDILKKQNLEKILVEAFEASLKKSKGLV